MWPPLPSMCRNMQKHPPKAPERRNFSFEFERHIHWLVCQKWFEIFLQGVILVNVGTLALQVRRASHRFWGTRVDQIGLGGFGLN